MVQILGTLNCERSSVTPDDDDPLVTPRSASYWELRFSAASVTTGSIAYYLFIVLL